MKRLAWGKLIVTIAICQSAGIIGSVFTAPVIPAWYASLDKPWFTPPAWIFGPVWGLLYTLMGIALYLIWSKGLSKTEVELAVILFLVHLAFNAAWSIIFFGFRDIAGALTEIILLWSLVAVLIVKFYQIDKWAGRLLLPYLVWVSFAVILTRSLWALNP